jgi:hypothetical protein
MRMSQIRKGTAFLHHRIWDDFCHNLDLENGRLSLLKRDVSRMVVYGTGGPATATMASVLSSGAHLVSYAWLSGLPIHVPQGDLIGKRLNIHGFWMYYEEYLPKMRAALTEATKVVASGKLTLPVTTT